jgi:hypothetical protein
MKLIVAGGRDYPLEDDDFDKLSSIDGITELVSGGAKGVDQDAETWATSKNIPIKQFKADWKSYGRAAGPVRNREMAKYADAVVLFPGGKGTASMHKIAVKENLTIFDYRLA